VKFKIYLKFHYINAVLMAADNPGKTNAQSIPHTTHSAVYYN